jgi:hypothetical protein
MSTNPPSMPPYQPQGYPGQYPPPPMKKKTSPWVWVLVGLGVFILLSGIAVVGAGYFFFNKAKQAGFDTDLMQRNPALASVKMMAALNPDIEVLNIDDDKGIVHVRDKKSGKSFTVNLEDAKKGKFSFQEDGKAPVTITASGNGNDGTLEIKSSDGTMKMGGGGAAKVPTWMPDYPGSSPTATFSQKSADTEMGNYTFKTSDPVDKVSKFYEEGLKSAGFKITTTMSHDGDKAGGLVSGEAGGKTASVAIGSEGSETTVNVTYKIGK